MRNFFRALAPIALLLTTVSVPMIVTPVHADVDVKPDKASHEFGVSAGGTNGGLSGETPTETADAQVTYVTEPVCQGPYAPGETCLSLACPHGKQMITIPIVNGVRDDAHAYAWCPSEQAELDPVPGAVARAFAQVPVPAAVLSIQPPKGKTLVGLETIFSTTAEAFTRTLTLLGRRIQLQITPSTFTWHHGDGTTQTTDWAGRAWDGNDDMDRYLTHTYEHTGTVHPSVTVTWTATWRIGNSPWRAVDGTVTKAGVNADLAIVEAEPELVAP